jgi:hypothetical protein
MLSSWKKFYHQIRKNTTSKTIRICHMPFFARPLYLYVVTIYPFCVLYVFSTSKHPEPFSKAEFANWDEGPPFSKITAYQARKTSYSEGMWCLLIEYGNISRHKTEDIRHYVFYSEQSEQ